MNDCERMRQLSLALVALAPGDPELERGQEHARTCPGCAQALREARWMLALIDVELAPPPPSVEVLLSCCRQVEEAQEQERRAAPPRRAAHWIAALATLAACAASAALAALAASAPGLFAEVGVHCLAFELFTAAGPVAAVAAAGGFSAQSPRWLAAALAAAGALAGQVALHHNCAAHSAGPHLLLFHLGGVALAALAGRGFQRAARFAL